MIVTTNNDFEWLNDLVEKMSDQDFHGDFWNCECEENYIHRQTECPYCYKCDSFHGEHPYSRVSEVAKMLRTELIRCSVVNSRNGGKS